MQGYSISMSFFSSHLGVYLPKCELGYFLSQWNKSSETVIQLLPDVGAYCEAGKELSGGDSCYTGTNSAD